MNQNGAGDREQQKRDVFAPLLGLLLRVPNLTLGASLALYALVHVFGWTVPAWPNGHWAFNPLPAKGFQWIICAAPLRVVQAQQNDPVLGRSDEVIASGAVAEVPASALSKKGCPRPIAAASSWDRRPKARAGVMP